MRSNFFFNISCWEIVKVFLIACFNGLNFFFFYRYVLSTIFLPGDRHVLAGLKNGMLLIIDIAAGDILEEIPAHSGELWSICLEPDQVITQ